VDDGTTYEEADAPTGPNVIEGSNTVRFKFVVTNIGTATLTNITLTDSIFDTSSCTIPDTLAPVGRPGSSFECEIGPITAEAGQHTNTATATGDYDAAMVDDTNDANYFGAPAPVPALSLVKSLQSNADEDGSGDVTLGDTLTYSFVATNTGTSNLTNVTITDPLPGLSALNCTPTQPASLAPGATLECTATYVVTAADVSEGAINNTATANSGQTDPVQDSETVPVVAPGLSLTKSLSSNADEDGSGDVTEGDTLTYSFVATNTGTSNLTNVTITDPLPGLSALNCTPTQPASLAPGATLECTATYVVTAADVTAGQINNTATADSDQTGPVDDTETVPVEPTPFECVADPFIVFNPVSQLNQINLDLLGSSFTFNTIANPINGLQINNLGYRSTDNLLYGWERNGADNGGQIVQIDSTGVVIGLGNPGLPSNQGAAYNYNAGDVSVDGSTMYLSYSVTNGAGDLLYVVDLPTLTLSTVNITGDSGEVADWAAHPTNGLLYGGDQTGWELAVLNPATGARTDLDIGLPDEGSSGYGAAWFDASGRLFLYHNSGKIYAVDNVDTVPTLVGGAYPLINLALNTTNNDGANCAAGEPPEVIADLSLSKSVSNETPNVGDTVAFTIQVSNAGPYTATGVSIEDVVPAGYSNITNISGTGSLSGNTITWSGLIVPVGDNTVTLTFVAVVDAPTGADGEYLNVAQVTASDQADPDSAPNNDDGDQSEDDEDSASTTPVALGTVSGHVYEDTNGNGVQDAGEPDLAGVQVEITDSAGNTQTVTTDANGDYSATVPAGDTTIDIVDATLPAGVTQTEGTDTTTVTVPSGGTASDIDGYQPPTADLSLSKTVDDPTPNVDDVVTFTIQVSNDGPDAATGVSIQDVVPAGYSTITNISGGGTESGGTITWSGLDVPVGANTVTLTFDATVEAPTGTTDEYKNVVQVTASDQFDPDSTPNNNDPNEDDQDSASVTPQEADLSLVKTVSDETPNVGDVVTFTIQVSNDGPDAATGVSIQDVVPAGYSSISNISNGGSESGGTITWSGLDVPVGPNTLTLTFDATVEAPTGATDEYKNVAQVTASDQFDPDSTPDNDDGNQSEDDEDNASVTPPGHVEAAQADRGCQRRPGCNCLVLHPERPRRERRRQPGRFRHG
jgi:uncharacterized repeat protein (TIGR01451 family)